MRACLECGVLQMRLTIIKFLLKLFVRKQIIILGKKHAVIRFDDLEGIVIPITVRLLNTLSLWHR